MIKPIKIFISENDYNNREIEEVISEWMEENRATLHETSLKACWELANNEKIDDVQMFHFCYVESIGNLKIEQVIAEVGVDREGMHDTLDECQEWYVSNEDYEAAAKVVECRKKLK